MSETEPVIFAYLDHKDSELNTLENIFGSLLKQLLQFRPSDDVFSKVEHLYQKCGKLGPRNWREVLGLLEAAIRNYDRVYIVLDALDACSSNAKLELELHKLHKSQPARLSLMITARETDGRLHDIFCDRCRKISQIYFRCLSCNGGDFDLCQRCKENGESCEDKSHESREPYAKVQVEITARASELEKYIKWGIEGKIGHEIAELRDRRLYPTDGDCTTLEKECRKDPELLRSITSEVIEKADGNMLFVSLYMNQLDRATNLKEIRIALENIPGGPEEIYENTVKLIKGQKHGDFAMRVLFSMACTRRYLTLVELEHLLATDREDKAFDKDKCRGREFILKITVGLVSMSNYDENPVVHFWHFTLGQYLYRTRGEWFPSAELDLAVTCLTYLSYDAVADPCLKIGEFVSTDQDKGSREQNDFETKTRNYPLVAYASQFWGDHARVALERSNQGLEEYSCLEKRIVQFLSKNRRVIAFVQAAAWSTAFRGTDGWDVSLGVTGLHVCAWFGLTSVIRAIARERAAIQVDDGDITYGQTPLMYACKRGHVSSVRELLNQNAAINITSKRGSTALFEAVLHNHSKVVGVLLDQKELETNAICSTKRNRTALMLAAIGGQSEIVGVLLKQQNLPRLNVNIKDVDGNTALSLAAFFGFSNIVEMLLEQTEVDINSVDKYGRSALSLAAQKNNDNIVELLRQGDANPSMEDKLGRTAILWAVEFGAVDVVKRLLEEDEVNAECRDNYGRGLLHRASATAYWNPEIIHLLNEKRLDLDSQDRYGMTPLHNASQSGYLEIVETLCDLGADAAVTDCRTRTPLALAQEYGQTPVARFLEERNGEHQDTPLSTVKFEALPVWRLVELGRSDLVAQAIKVRKLDLPLEKAPYSDDTALHLAVLYNELDILQMLLQEGEMSPDSFNNIRRTPLHLAAINGFLKATQVLIDHHANVDLEDQYGETALCLAITNFPLACALIGAGANTRDTDAQRFFYAAVELNQIAAVRVLLTRGVQVLVQDRAGLRAIDIARKAGNEEMIKILQESEGFRYTEEERNAIKTSGKIRHKKSRPSLCVAVSQPVAVQDVQLATKSNKLTQPIGQVGALMVAGVVIASALLRYFG